VENREPAYSLVVLALAWPGLALASRTPHEGLGLGLGLGTSSFGLGLDLEKSLGQRQYFSSKIQATWLL